MELAIAVIMVVIAAILAVAVTAVENQIARRVARKSEPAAPIPAYCGPS